MTGLPGAELQLDVDDTAALVAASDVCARRSSREPLPGWLEKHPRGICGVAVVIARRPSRFGLQPPRRTESRRSLGMNETFLNVRQRRRSSTRRVVAGLRVWRSHGVYRAKRGLPQAEMDIAVVVQLQVASTRAGVMFTIDPSTDGPIEFLRDRRLIWARSRPRVGQRFARPLRGGQGDVVDRQAEVRAKELAIEPVEGGGQSRRRLSAEESMRPVLDDAEVGQLAALAVKIERHYRPEDTEWAFDGEGHVWTSQSRPVTSAATGARETAPARALRRSAASVRHRKCAGRCVSSGPRANAGRLSAGDVLVTHMTSPDWVPLMRC